MEQRYKVVECPESPLFLNHYRVVDTVFNDKTIAACTSKEDADKVSNALNFIALRGYL